MFQADNVLEPSVLKEMLKLRKKVKHIYIFMMIKLKSNLDNIFISRWKI